MDIQPTKRTAPELSAPMSNSLKVKTSKSRIVSALSGAKPLAKRIYNKGAALRRHIPYDNGQIGAAHGMVGGIFTGLSGLVTGNNARLLAGGVGALAQLWMTRYGGEAAPREIANKRNLRQKMLHPKEHPYEVGFVAMTMVCGFLMYSGYKGGAFDGMRIGEIMQGASFLIANIYGATVPELSDEGRTKHQAAIDKGRAEGANIKDHVTGLMHRGLLKWRENLPPLAVVQGMIWKSNIDGAIGSIEGGDMLTGIAAYLYMQGGLFFTFAKKEGEQHAKERAATSSSPSPRQAAKPVPAPAASAPRP